MSGYSHCREVIHISLGPSSNAVSAHLMNLEGLAATNGSCESLITHHSSQDSNAGVLTPRVLFVEERPAGISYDNESGTAPNPTIDVFANNDVLTWAGSVEMMQQQSTATDGYDEPIASIDQQKKLAAMHQAADVLAYASFSRYRQAQTSNDYNAYSTSSSNSRHVQWDDNEEEEEEENDEERQRRKQREKLSWQQQTQAPLEQQMQDFWASHQSQTPTGASSRPHLDFHWYDFLMPPYSKDCRVSLPFSKASYNAVDANDTYLTGISSYETTLSERLRKMLEECDAIQGITIATQSHGIYAGLTTALLQEMQDECRTAGRFVWNIVDSSVTSSENTPYQVAQTGRLRRYIQEGLALSGATNHAHAVLPIVLDPSESLFASSAQIALALEASTLAYRLNPSTAKNMESKIGLIHGFYGGSGVSDEGYGVAANLSFGEYLACLQPSPKHSILELDAAFDSESKLDSSLQVGTSVERTKKLQAGQRERDRPLNVLPGDWLSQHMGLLSSYSPLHDGSERSLHRHFSLTSSFRPSSMSLSTSQYLTCLVESMVIPYRPEVSMATVTSESVASLTDGGYGAGSYWKSLHLTPPVLSVIGNTTKSYPYLHSIASSMKQTLSQKFRGYHSRDAAAGILPEAEDCEEAMQHCFQVRDVYCPPDSSGLAVDEEGTYFDNNI